ncbi:Exosome component 3 [Geranomyces variabilis]|uniref:Ribosomal RNA-processing protein 40 n=1 Tax=Geranomyces variabilis TaxID=109894 RepID=A0AAD5TJ95_9FUNG|nr:Exosome component 3 [Geranomyces variabilis]
MALAGQSQPNAARKILIPGDRIPLVPDAAHQSKEGPLKVRVGPGLQQEQGDLVAVKAGVLKQAGGSKYWMDGSQKRYVPAASDPVLGTVTARQGESFRVDIGSAHPAALSILAFEGATRRNRPNLDVGSLVYCRLSVANKDMEPELECVDPATGKAGGYGELKGGFVVKCSLRMARGYVNACSPWNRRLVLITLNYSLLNPKNPIVTILAESISFELAVGLNGRVWINAKSCAEVIAVAKVIQACDGAAASDINKLINHELRRLEDAMDTS